LTTAVILPDELRDHGVSCRGFGARVRHKGQMPVPSPYVIVMSDEEEAVLVARAQSVRSQYRDRLRARIVLAAGAGTSNAAIAAQVGVCPDTVRKWRRRFAADGLPGLKDAPRSGRPPVFSAADRAGAVALACALPAESGVPLSKWSCPELARELAARRQVAASASTVRRWLAGDALKPWQHRSWISVRDPGFAVKAARVLDLYAGIWDGGPLGENDYVICADEKTSIQARCRCHPTLPPGRARAMRVQHDYKRGGALAYLAAWDVHRGQVTGRCEHTTGIAPFSRLAGQVMTAEPYASADRVFWIVDNGSSHRGTASVKRMTKAWPNAHLIHCPCTPPGLTRRRSASPSSSARSSARTTSPTWTRSATAWPRSRSATTPSPDRSPGNSPAPGSTTCYTASTPTTRPSPTPWRPDLYPR
jgi:transposase